MLFIDSFLIYLFIIISDIMSVCGVIWVHKMLND